ncbi:MBL fold metallo-hydrolase [Rhodovastum atsumiense]|uniref:MBL fold metallo-hydrolase n=1 Tax=Rhodovastum atsumiense TaxID=504468 RepID=A0A5M6IJH1_9PROT|nr:MBL fold metallo-hydrolase [Rhodovastum atsumiense]KAA5608411.1 MBL fold metallo-hydrolase [Rhodovastum atsumiense]CAH2599399.1 MBL fold metallo-hydrolase [Rhodovastum atsumiense]
MGFLTEPEPARGVPLPAAPGVVRLVADNPGPMTGHGTNTWLIEDDGITVLDPGPDDARHVQAILRATSGRVRRILVSHTHRDHIGAVPALAAATGAPVHGFHRPQDPGFVPDVALDDGDMAGAWRALHTPGHAGDHLCFARADGVILTADHVMTWSTSVVSPPEGDMAAYVASLRRLIAREDRLLLPGHGPPLAGPATYLRELLDHRLRREAAILAAISAGSQSLNEIVECVYVPLNPDLRPAAGRNVLAHLLKLQQEGRARPDGTGWRAA